MAKKKRKSSKTGAFGNPKLRMSDIAQSGLDSALGSSRHYVERAMDRTRKEDINGALSDAEQAVKLDPKDGDAYLSRGRAKAALGRHQQAIADFTRALRCPDNSLHLRSDFPQICHWDRADSKAELGNDAGAIADYNRAIEWMPDSPELYFNRAQSKAKLGNHAGAIEDYDRAFALNFHTAEAHLMRGICNSELGNHVDAISDYDRSIAYSTGRDSDLAAIAWYNTGRSEIRLGNIGKAIADFNRFIDLSPRDPDGYYQRGMCRIHRGDWDDSITDFIEAKSLNPDLSANCYSWMGLASSGKEDYHGALEAYGRSLALNPDFVPAYCNRGYTEASQGNYDSAISAFNRALELDPERAEIYLQLGSVKTVQGDYDGAIADYTQVLALDPDQSSCYLYRAVAYLRKGDDQAAKADCELAGIQDLDALLATELGQALYSLTEPTSPVTSGEPPATDTDQSLELAEKTIEELTAKVEHLERHNVDIEQEAEAAKEDARRLQEQLRAVFQQMSLANRHLPKGDYEQVEPKTTITSGTLHRVHYYTDRNGNDPFSDWLGQLAPAKQEHIRNAIQQMERGNPGDHKSLRGNSGLFERRLIATRTEDLLFQRIRVRRIRAIAAHPVRRRKV